MNIKYKIINWFVENNISYNDFSDLFQLNDFSTHMFDTSEFIKLCKN